ncbi:MAG: hypothetical protein ACXABH_10540, partial [Candidatus Thorarchaeota archaeon]
MEFTSEVAVAVRRNPGEALKTALSKLTFSLVPPKNTERVIVKTSIYDPSKPGNTDVNMVRAVGRLFESLGP